ncbi:MAG: SH3 domain-containing protein [Rhodobacteraceae bacterium]|nr:SH3 domain-containing protein [Paracoccaceae bacterium]
MKSFIFVSFAFLGVAFYQLSGGADFVPELRQNPDLADASTADLLEQSAPELVARAAPPAAETLAPQTLASASLANTITAPHAPQEQAILASLATPFEETVQEAEVELASLAIPLTPAADLREVAGNRVNMRTGPSTDYAVIETLVRGTLLQVLETDANGWAHIRMEQSGVEGWMAERLLSPVNG